MDTQQIKNKIDIIGYYERRLQFTYKHGKNWKSKCPFHVEQEGSFSVNIEDGLWHCFGCGEHGDIITFHQKFYNETFEQAIAELSAESGLYENVSLQKTEIAPESKPKTDTESNTKKTKRHPDINEDTVLELAKALPDHARDYLVNRGITETIIKKYKIGWYNGYLVFPIYRNKKIFTYRFRSISEKKIWQLSTEEIGENPIWLWPEPEEKTVLLCEGETDTLTALSLGYPACTITGGAGTFHENLFPLFHGLNVNICYDIDERGELGAISVSRKICQVAKNCKIVNLNLSKTKYPTGDLNDYFAKEFHSREEFDCLIENADRVSAACAEFNIIERRNCYYRTTEIKNTIHYKKISNFVLRMCSATRVDNVLIRSIQFLQEGKSISQPYEIISEQMYSGTKFRSFCFNCGTYNFEGKDADLDNLWKLLFDQSVGIMTIFGWNKIGYNPEKIFWISEKFAYKDGKVLSKNENNIFIENDNTGHIITSRATNGPQFSDSSLPLTDTIMEIKDLAGLIVSNTGVYESLFGLAFCCGTVYFREIQKRFSSFPLLWVYGTLQCGKNTYCQLLMNLFGMMSNHENLPAITSTVGISRLLNNYSAIPIWLDEYRTSLKNVEGINGVLRGAYQASGRTYGLRQPGKYAVETFTTSVIISGEELPNDEALCTRLIPVNLIRARRNDTVYPEVFEKSKRCAEHIVNLIKTKNENTINKLLDSIEYYQLKINAIQKNARSALNKAIIISCYQQFIDPDDTIIENYICSPEFRESSEIYDSECGQTKLISDFIEDVSFLIATKKIEDITWYSINDGRVYIWLWLLYNKWSKHRNENRLPVFNYKTIVDNFKITNYFLSSGIKKRIYEKNSIINHIRSCVIFDLTKIPMSIKTWLDLDIEDSERKNEEQPPKQKNLWN